MARNGPTAAIYKFSFVSEQSIDHFSYLDYFSKMIYFNLLTCLVNFRTEKKILRSSLYRENRHDEFGAYEVMEFMFG